jgi:potassium-dependent mechanosensitive channel
VWASDSGKFADAKAAAGRHIGNMISVRPHKEPLRRRWLGPLLAFALACCPAAGQVPGLATRTEDPAAPAETPKEGSAGTLAAVQKQLAQARDRLRAIPESGEALPEGVASAEATEKRIQLSGLVFALEAMVRSQQELEALGPMVEEARRADQRWQGFDIAPPYPLALADECEDAADLANQRVKELKAALANAGSQLDLARNRLQQTESAERQAREAADNARDDPAKAAANWRADLAALRRENASTGYRLAEISLEIIRQRLAQASAQAHLENRRVETLRGKVRYADADLAAALAGMAARRARLQTDLDAARQRRRDFSDDDLARLREALATEKATPGFEGDAKASEARLRAAETRAEADRAALEVLESLVAVYQVVEDLWRGLFAAIVSPEPEPRREAAAKLREFLTRLETWKVWADSEAEAIDRMEQQVEARALESLEPAVRAAEQEAFASLRARAAAVKSFQRATAESSRMAERWLGRFAADTRQLPWDRRLKDAAAAATERVSAVWNYELFTAKETHLVDGRETVVTRGVTLGKTLVALLMFLGGWAIIRRLGGRGERLFISRLAMTEPHARLLRRGVESLGLLVVLLVALHLVRIPVTAFAFLGGALAIGVGFGTQTIIKNLISGLIVLGERKVRVGDIIEVDGIAGTVTTIDARACIVRGFDGVESIVPNSVLLENRVTSWTYSNRNVRRSLNVGIAYGSPVRQAAEILEECARRHGVILDDPKPLVIFADFADSSLLLTLFFWVPMRPEVNANVVASDLRFMIEKRFGEAGISIPFPQREVHMAPPRPRDQP